MKILTNHFPFRFHAKLALCLGLGFMLFTVIGTLTHEGGHYLAARYCGQQARINYMSTQHVAGKDDYFRWAIHNRYWPQIRDRQSFPLEATYNALVKKRMEGLGSGKYGGRSPFLRGPLPPFARDEA